MSDNGKELLVETHEGVMTIRIDRPKVNAFTTDLVRNMLEVFRQAERDEQVRVVVLGGKGGVFSAGQDLTEVKRAEDTSFRYHLQRTYNPLVLQIRRLEKPVLASINGAVSGAAFGVVLACDLRIAAENARFVVGFLGIGLAPDSAISLLLPATVGLGRAAEFAFTNTTVDAQQALALGLVNRVVPAGELDDQTMALASALARGPIHAMGLTKRAFNKAVLPHLEQVLDYEAHIQDIAGRGEEHKEGVSAFLEKRPASYYPLK
jgi:2-(1,2-epoxy-1,2-dihydrophenyl)acetyl-CoA isomerase